MLSNAKKCIALLLLSTSWHGACAQTREDFLQAPDRIEWEAGGLYEGRFDDGTTFRIALAYPEPEAVPQRAAHAFAQSVWTPRHYTGTPSTLLAAGSANGQTRLAVANARGVASEETYAVTLTPDHASGRGVWSGPRIGEQRNFTLPRSVTFVGVVVARPASAELAAFSDYYREHGFTFSSVFPVLGNRDADEWIRDEAGICQDSGECANAVRIDWQSPSLVSLQALIWGDSGGAHGNGYSVTRQYGIDNGAMTQLALDDFIDPGAACRNQVTKSIAASLHKLDMRLPDPRGGDPWRGAKFTPTPDGIAFYYNSYEAGSYAQGAPTVFVPREEMAACSQHLPAAD